MNNRSGGQPAHRQFKRGYALRGFPELKVGYPKQQQDFRVPWHDGKDLTIDRFCLFQAPALLQQIGMLKLALQVCGRFGLLIRW